MKTMAAVVTIPGRPVERVLRSLRGQVDVLAVFCNGFMDPPAIVRALADLIATDPDDLRGSSRKLHWADQWDGLYLACDDDIEYPADYAKTMAREVARWDGVALVTSHGRVLRPYAKSFSDCHYSARPFRDEAGRWLNYPGGGTLGWDSSVLHVPPDFPDLPKNREQLGVALWAQDHGVPIRLVAHSAEWLTPLPVTGRTIWAEEKRAGFPANAIIAEAERPWTVFLPAPATPVPA